MLELDDLKKMHDKAYDSNQVTREQASDDLVFYWVTQWDDQLLTESQLAFRGEFNILRKAGRKIMADLRSNPVQPDFKPKDESRNDDAEVMDGIYRADDRRLGSQEAYDYASQDAVVCGYGAWEIYTDYSTNIVGDTTQVIKRRYIPEANNTCFWDPNATRLDKSDAKYCSILYAYSREGYMDLVEEMTGERPTESMLASFKQPEQSYTFPWAGGSGERYYIAVMYHRETVKDKIITLVDMLGQSLTVRQSDMYEMIDELIDDGYEIVVEKEIERQQVTRYTIAKDEILDEQIIAGENIPVVPVYGEHAPQIEGQEVWQGITRLAKDPQRLRNFQMSYLADIVSRSPRPKPIFFPEQVQGFEFMYEVTGADNNYPYLLQNSKDHAGNPLPVGPASQMPDQPIPQALAASIELTRQAVEDVANPGVPQDIADPDLSGKAVYALQNQIDQQSYIYQHNMKHAKKRDAEIYASMASQVIDTPRKLTIETPDGQTVQIEMMQVVMDPETGTSKVINDVTNMEFDVYAEIGPSYESQKQQTIDTLSQMAAAMPETDPLKKIITYKLIELIPGVQTDDVRDYVRKQLIIMGIKQPETEEEMMMVQQASQQEPDPMQIAAMAEMEKAQAAKMREMRQAQKDQADAQINAGKLQVDAYKAQTDRAEQEVKAAEAGVSISKQLSEKQAIDIDNQIKSVDAVVNAYRGRI